MIFKYGKLPPKVHSKTLKLALFTAGITIPPPPEVRAWEYRISDADWASTMFGNDQVGDCVIAAMLHWIMCATANTDQPATFTTDDAIKVYTAITGYDPSQTDALGNNPTDKGTAWTDALAYWQETGIVDDQGRTHKILGFGAIDHTNIVALRQGIDIFGGVLVGTSVTRSMEEQFGSSQPWNPPFDASVGLHGVPWFGFGREGETCLTWAKRQQMSLEAVGLLDEAYAPITQDWVDQQTAKSPSGFDLAGLQAALAAMRTA